MLIVPLYNTYTDRELLNGVASGDIAAFKQLFDQYKMRLYSFVLKMTHSKADAEEIVQEVFTKLWTNRATLHEVEFPGKYIYTIARNKTLNHLARAARDQQLQQQLWVNVSQYHNTTEELLQAQESQRLINEAISLLSPQRQTIFRLSREQGLTHEEIGAQLGLSKSRIKNILVEVLKHIKDHLARYAAILPILFWF